MKTLVTLCRFSVSIVAPCRRTRIPGIRSVATWPSRDDVHPAEPRNSWDRFLRGGAAGVAHVRVVRQQEGTEKVQLSWEDGHESEFSAKWLRDHCTEAFNLHTKQREVDTYMVPNGIQVRKAWVTTAIDYLSSTEPPATSTAAAAAAAAPAASTRPDDQPQQVLKISWGDGGSSGVAECRQSRHVGEGEQNPGPGTIPITWLRQHCTSPTARELRRRYGGLAAARASPRPRPVLWCADVFSPGAAAAACLHHDEVMAGGEEARRQPPPPPHAQQEGGGRGDGTSGGGGGGSARLVDLLLSRGIALVRGVPTNEASTERLALRVGGHLRSTLYGPGMWATSAEVEAGEEAFRDSAYSNGALALHTDCGYLADPPGIQVFNCVVRAEEGGESTYIDGFAVAERLRQESPEAFDFFARTPLSYQCFDDGCHYMAEGPVFRLGALDEVVQVRHNDYDRAPLDYLSNDDIDRFYEHHKSLSAIVRDPSLVARILLEPGDCVILDNHRTLHGRESFKGKRRMVGCYLGMDELHSAARVQGA